MPISQNADGVFNDELNKFDHIVVLMLENRSFDNFIRLFIPRRCSGGQ